MTYWRTACLAALVLIGSLLSAPPALADLQKGTEAFDRQDYATARAEFLAGAEEGDPAAMTALGWLYAEGLGVSQEYEQAIALYRKAAAQGFALAQFNLGVLYGRGVGLPLDYKQAMDWYRKAAEQGSTNAQVNLGLMYEQGQGVPRDYKLAVAWYRKAADQGEAIAQRNLGVAYQTGHGVSPDGGRIRKEKFPTHVFNVETTNKDLMPKWLPQVVDRLSRMAPTDTRAKMFLVNSQAQIVNVLPDKASIIQAAIK